MTTDEQRAEWRRMMADVPAGPWLPHAGVRADGQVILGSSDHVKLAVALPTVARFARVAREAMPALLAEADMLARVRGALLDVRAILADVQDGTPWQVAVDSALLRIGAALSDIA